MVAKCRHPVRVSVSVDSAMRTRHEAFVHSSIGRLPGFKKSVGFRNLWEEQEIAQSFHTLHLLATTHKFFWS